MAPNIPVPVKLSREKRRTIKRWVKALRSGKYQQAEAELVTHNEYGEAFCCLGVLCDIKGIETYEDLVVGDHAIQITDGAMIHAAMFERLTGLEANPTIKFVSDEEEDDEGNPIERTTWIEDFPDSYANYLAAQNDKGATFNTIADIIEERADEIHPNWKDGL